MNMKIEMKNVKWEALDDDDFIYREGDYTLRVEQMHKKIWWWCVYWLEDTVAEYPNVKTKREAKYLAELNYWKKKYSKLSSAQVIQVK